MNHILNDKGMNELRSLMNDSVFTNQKQSTAVKAWRNDTTADWIQNVMDRLTQAPSTTPSHQIDESTGKVHTVESMVASFKDRIQLDVLSKQADIEFESSIPLTILAIREELKKKAHDELGRDINDEFSRFISDFISSHRGYTSVPGIIYALRDKFGNELVEEYDEYITEFIAAARKQHQGQDISGLITDSWHGAPIPAASGDGKPQAIFENMKGI